MCLGTRSSSLTHSLGSDWHIPDHYLVDLLHPLLLLLSSPLSRSFSAPVVETLINCCGDYRVKKYSQRIYDAALFCVCKDSLGMRGIFLSTHLCVGDLTFATEKQTSDFDYPLPPALTPAEGSSLSSLVGDMKTMCMGPDGSSPFIPSSFTIIYPILRFVLLSPTPSIPLVSRIQVWFLFLRFQFSHPFCRHSLSFGFNVTGLLQAIEN
jgi:hypothetical protein